MKNLLLFFCGLAMAAAVQAQIIHVPGDYPTIQEGIDNATSGDTVLVADGIYFEQINFLGKKPLMVASEFLTDGDTTHIGNTIIDGSHLIDSDNASVVYFISGEDTTSILCGFTIRNGIGTYLPDFLDTRYGGGILVATAGAKIIHNRITQNILDNTQFVNGTYVCGGGIATPWEEEGDYWVVIDHNTIDSNTCISNAIALGGGISTCYNSRIVNNIISYNTSSAMLDGNAQAAGIWCGGDNAWLTSIVMVVENNSITNNLSQSEYNFATAAGIATRGVTMMFSHNKVEENTVISGSDVGGIGGLSLYQPDTGCVVSNNVFRGNDSNLWGGGIGMQNDIILQNPVLIENNYFIDNSCRDGGAFETINVPVTLQNNVFHGNHATNDGGALYLWDWMGAYGHLATLVNNTFSGNSASASGGAICSNGADPVIFNCIFWQDSSDFAPEIRNLSGALEIAYSNIDTNDINGTRIIGPGVMHEDPLFADPETLHPATWGPCVDAGAAQYSHHSGGGITVAPLFDILGTTRPAGAGFDMGAYEDIKGGVGTGRMTNDELRMTNVPNPFSGNTTFVYSLRKPTTVTIQIFNSVGQVVDEPVNTWQQGDQRIEWNSGNLPAGIYFYRIQAGDKVGSGKMVKW